MPAAKLDIYIEQGALFEMFLTSKDSLGNANDLTGFQFEGQVRESHSSATPVASFQFELLDQSQPATKGKVRAFIPDSVTAAIPVKSKEQAVRLIEKFLYDLYAWPTGGQKVRWVEGVANVSGEATK